jgi:hypothetical protein
MAELADPQVLMQRINRIAMLFQEGIAAFGGGLADDEGVDPGPPIGEPKRKDPGINQRRVRELLSRIESWRLQSFVGAHSGVRTSSTGCSSGR